MDTWVFEWTAESRDDRLRNPPVDVTGEVGAILDRIESLEAELADDDGMALLRSYRDYGVLLREAYTEYQQVLTTSEQKA